MHYKRSQETKGHKSRNFQFENDFSIIFNKMLSVPRLLRYLKALTKHREHQSKGNGFFCCKNAWVNQLQTDLVHLFSFTVKGSGTGVNGMVPQR